MKTFNIEDTAMILIDHQIVTNTWALSQYIVLREHSDNSKLAKHHKKISSQRFGDNFSLRSVRAARLRGAVSFPHHFF